jgi:uncharacterized protein
MATGDRSQFFPAIEKKHGRPASHWIDLVGAMDGAKYDEQMEVLQAGHGFSRTHANAIVMTARGSTTSRRVDTPDAYFASIDPALADLSKRIFASIRKSHRGLELVIAWNQPMLRIDGAYVFSVSAAKNHLTASPCSGPVMAEFAYRLAGLTVNKKTFRIPPDWKIDDALLRDMVSARLAEIARD